jgi:hypothetical protein
MGKAAPLPPLAVEGTLALFGETWGVARRAYARFVAAGVRQFDPAPAILGQAFLGDEAFVARALRHAVPPSREVPKRQRAWKSLAQYQRESGDRDVAIRLAYQGGGYTLAQIGEHFGLHYATVSRLARRS